MGASLEGIDPADLTITETPVVLVDCDENRRLRPDSIDTTGFVAHGDPVGDEAPYNLRIVAQFY